MVIRSLLDLVLPASCAGCAAPGAAWCPRCDNLLAPPALHVRPAPAPAGFPRCHAVAAYDGAVRAALIAYKERGRRDLRGPLGAALSVSVTSALGPAVGSTASRGTAGPLLLVPVPSRRRAIRERGADTTRSLAGEAGRLLRRAGLDARMVPALRLGRATADSAGLCATARATNLSGAMTAEPGYFPDHPVAIVVVDDLLTTGATLAEAARALAAVGRPATAAGVVAATLRRGVGFGAWSR